MIRRTLGLGGALVLLASMASSAAPAAPDGPRLAFVSLESGKHGQVRLESVDQSGSGRATLRKGSLDGGKAPLPFFGPSWFPDGSRLAFAASTGEKRQAIYTIGADGNGLRVVPGTKQGAIPVLSPDGHTLAFARSRFRFHIDVHHLGKTHFYSSTTTWIVDLETGSTRRLTKWRNGLSNMPASFSPDGSMLALTKRDDHLDGPRAILMPLDGNGTSLLAREAVEPIISPDGAQVALISYVDGNTVESEEGEDVPIGELYVIRADGMEPRRLTHTHDRIESRPSWDPSGQRIAYDQSRASTGNSPGVEELFPFGNAIMQINADGTCRRQVISVKRAALYGAVWQPGIGREAGRIAC